MLKRPPVILLGIVVLGAILYWIQDNYELNTSAVDVVRTIVVVAILLTVIGVAVLAYIRRKHKQDLEEELRKQRDYELTREVLALTRELAKALNQGNPSTKPAGPANRVTGGLSVGASSLLDLYNDDTPD